MKYLIQLLDKTIVSFTSFICSLHPMGYSLILLLLILSSCTDKENTNQESTTQDMLIAELIELEKDSEKLQTNTKPLIASYDKGLDVLLIQSDFASWYGGYILMLHDERDHPYSYDGVYWDKNNNQYYRVIIERTNNIIYTLDSNLQHEALLYPVMADKISDKNGSLADTTQQLIEAGKITTNLLGNELLYVGSISPTERIFIDRLNKELFIKRLIPVLNKTSKAFVTQDLTTPVYPVLPSSYGSLTFNLYYTNINKERFNIVNPRYYDDTSPSYFWKSSLPLPLN